MSGAQKLVDVALANPALALAELDRVDAEEHLLDYMRCMWSILEPAREFVEGWALSAICEHLEAVSAGQIRRLLINVPPGCTKSLTTNVFWPSWEWGPRNRPDLRYVSASYSEALTVRDNRRARHLIMSEAYQRNWGEGFHLVSDQNAKVRFDTNERGFKIATSVGGLGTGERGDRFIIDDPHNVKEADSEAAREAALQWFTEVVPTRLNDKYSVIVVIMQRVHEADVSGLILEKELGYTHLCLPMEHERARTCVVAVTGFADPRTQEDELLWPGRFSAMEVAELKEVLRSWGGTYAEAGQLQQRPSPRGGGMFQSKDFNYVDAPPAQLAKRCRGWDLAATKDAGSYTVGVLMSKDAKGRIYIEDVCRGQWTAKVVEDEVARCADEDGPRTETSLPQDPGQAGKAQKSTLAALLHGHNIHFSPESGAKEDRAKPLAAQAEAGNVYLVRGAWNDTFINEAKHFPKGRFLDQIDAASRAYTRLVEKPKRVPAGPVIVTQLDR